MALKKIILTGGDGFVGKILYSKLIEYGYSVKNIDRKNGYNISDWNNLKKIEEFDLLIHLAAKSYVPDSYSSPYEFYNVNVLGTLNMLELCRKNNASMIFTSSYVYGIPKYLPIDEKHPLEALNPYSHTKILGEDLCKSYNNNFGVPVTIIRPSNIYGYGQNKNFLMPTIMRQLHNNTMKLKDKNPKRDYIYIKDIINAYIKCLNMNDHKFRIFNIGGGKSYSVETIANMIITESKKDISIEFEESDRKNEVMDLMYDIKKANKILKWKPKYSLRNGVKEMITQNKMYTRGL